MAALRSKSRSYLPANRLAAKRLFASLVALSSLLYQDRSFTDELDRYRWQSRVVVVAAPSAEDPALNAQLAEARTDPAGWADRKLLLLVIEDGRLAGGSPGSEAQGGQIRRRLGLAEERFSLALIGLDGTVKLRRQTTVSNEDLYSLIDAMPMRREELRLRSRQ